MEEFRKLYGVGIASARKYPVSECVRHPMNPKREEDREEHRVFQADVKEQGIDKVMLLLKIPDEYRKDESVKYWILRGGRRHEAAEKAGDKTILAEMVIGRLDHKTPKDLPTLRQLIYRDTFLRNQYSEEEIQALILRNYGKDRILAPVPRGSSRSERSLLPLEREIERDWGMKRDLARYHLSGIRRNLKNEEAANQRQSITDDDEKTGLSMARRWNSANGKIERANNAIQKIKDDDIAPARKEQKDIEKELRKIGGLERFLKKLERLK